MAQPHGRSYLQQAAGMAARSAGTEPQARIKITEKMLAWADVIFVMEKKHKTRLLEKFGRDVELPPVVILDIPDDYQFMDHELIEDITTKVDSFLAGHL